MLRLLLLLFLLHFLSSNIEAQTNAELQEELEDVQDRLRNLRHNFNSLNKAVDDLMWYNRDYMVENYEMVDGNRVGILGWSHGGLITLMNLFDHPTAYKVGYAGVPVSDLIARMGYKTERYRDLYSVDYHIGKTAHKDVEEYRRRSPAWQAHKLQTPLLIHTNTNDADVNVLEVEHLIKSLKAEGKQFEYEIYQDKPGGHAFDRIDTKLAKEVRLKVYRFLAKYLKPPKEFKNLKALQKAGYGY